MGKIIINLTNHGSETQDSTDSTKFPGWPEINTVALWENGNLAVRVRLNIVVAHIRNHAKPQPLYQRCQGFTLFLSKLGGRPGGQVGHKETTLKRVQEPDEVIEHGLPERCDGCGETLPPSCAQIAERRQVFDIPVVR